MSQSQSNIDGTTTTSASIFNTNSAIAQLEEEVDDLKKIKADLMSSKNDVTRDHDAQRQQVDSQKQ